MNTTDMEKCLRNAHTQSTAIKTRPKKKKIIAKNAFKTMMIKELIVCPRNNKVVHPIDNCNYCVHHHECEPTINKIIYNI